MQALCEWDVRDYDTDQLKSAVKRVAAEFAPGLAEDAFALSLAEGVAKQKDKLDHIIEKAAPDWPLPQIAVVDRNILRLGLFELLFADKSEVPARVAINESIELAKTFGGEGSGRFTNGVLGAVYKEEVPAKKRRPKDVPYEQMPIEKLGGAVVYARSDDGIKLALVHDIFGYWTLSKGRIENNEDTETGAVREIKEELNLDIKVESPLGQNEYIASDPEVGKIRKQVTYFLAEAKNAQDIKLEEGKGGLSEAKWFPLAAVAELKMYDDILPIVTKAIKLLSE